jgi:hypothetical protein
MATPGGERLAFSSEETRMKFCVRASAVAVVIAGSAVGLAGPASADPLGGTYTAEIRGDVSPMTETQTWVFTPCGPDCTNLSIGEGFPVREMHLQGNTWAAIPYGDGGTCSTTIDNTTLAGETGCAPMSFHVQLTKA